MAASHLATVAPIGIGRGSGIDPHIEVGVIIDRRSGLELSTIAAGGDCATVQVAGEMDLANADLFVWLIDEQARRGRRFIRLDLSRLTFCDCAGLRAIVRAHNRLLWRRGELVLIGARGTLSRLLDLTELDEALSLADRFGGAHRGD